MCLPLAIIGNGFAEPIQAKTIQTFPGGILSVIYPKFLSPQDDIKLGQTKTIVIQKQEGYQIIAGIDINTIPGQYLLTIQSEKEQLDSIDYLVIATKHKILDSTIDHTQEPTHLINSKHVKNSLIWSNRPPKLPIAFPAKPTKGQWSDSFGQYYEKTKKKDFNENITQALSKDPKKNDRAISKKLHRIDHLSLHFNEPLAITAPSDATCFAISFDSENGYTVLLDHGMGLFSEISGLHNLSISEQDVVSKGALIANFTQEDFSQNEKTQTLNNKTIYWRVFLTKATINPRSLTKPL